MLQIQNKLISEDLLEKQFVCDLSACKGACCIEGDSGAPLEEEELSILDDIFEEVKPFLRVEGAQAIIEQGKYVQDADGDWVTPLREGKECAYTVFDENGIAGCGIEKAHFAGATEFRKPISCHLYPIRIKKLSEHEALNYHEWPICKPACECGAKLKMPVYKFCKDSIIRKYGQEFYEQLEYAEKNRNNNSQ